MKKISVWAKQHVWLSRFIIIWSFIVLTFSGIITGVLLKSLGMILPSVVLLFLIVIYTAAFIAYPSRSEKNKTITAGGFYRWQKSCDFLLVCSTFFMIVCMANRPEQLFQYDNLFAAPVHGKLSLPEDSLSKKYKSPDAFFASMKDEKGNPLKWKERKKLLKEQVSAIQKADDLSTGAKVALIILSVAIAAALLYGVAALACSLSCSGSEGAAVAVTIGGAGLVIFLLILAIRAILGKKKKKKKAIKQEAPAKAE